MKVTTRPAERSSVVLEVEFPADQVRRQVDQSVRHLGQRYPTLIGDVIQPSGDRLQVPNTFYNKDTLSIKPEQMDQRLQDGDQLFERVV